MHGSPKGSAIGKSPNGMQFARVFAHGRALMVNDSKDCEPHVKV